MIGEIIGSLIGAGASLFGGNKAEKQQAKNQKAALNLQREQYNNARELLSPYTTAGSGALDTYKTAIGLNGRDAQAGFYKDFQYDPGFQEGLDRSLADTTKKYAIYGDVGGGLAKDLLKTGQEARMGAFDKRVSQIGGIADSGRTAASALASGGQNMANASGTIIANTSQPYAASGVMNAGNALIGGIQNYQTGQQWQQGLTAGRNLNGVNGYGNSLNALTVPSNRVSW